MATATMLYFLLCEILLSNLISTFEAHHPAKLSPNTAIRCTDIDIFQFTKMVFVAILNFQNGKILLADVHGANTHHRASFSQNC